MFEIIAIIAIVLAVAIAIVLILAVTKPDTFSVQRTTTVKAPPEKIFSLINDFHQWGTWSPYENKDPAMKRTYSGADSGKGAVYAVGRQQECRLRPDGNSRRLGAFENRHQVRFLHPVRGTQHCRVHNAAAGRCHQSHLGYAWPRALYVQGDASVHQHGRHDRQGFCDRSRQPEEAHRKVSGRSMHQSARSKRCRSIPICSTTAIAKRRSSSTKRCSAQRSR